MPVKTKSSFRDLYPLILVLIAGCLPWPTLIAPAGAQQDTASPGSDLVDNDIDVTIAAGCAGLQPDEIVLPVYKPFAQLAGIQGSVHLEVLVSEAGDVERAEVQWGLPMGMTELAKSAATLWRFPQGLSERSVLLKFDFVLIPFDEDLPLPTVIDPNHVRIYGWSAKLVKTSYGAHDLTHSPRKRVAKLPDRPFLRLLKTADGDYRDDGASQSADVRLIGRDSCRGIECSLCISTSSLFQGTGAPLRVTNLQEGDEDVCMAGVLPFEK